MAGKKILLGVLVIMLLSATTEQRKGRGRKKLRGNMVNGKTIMLSDDPLLGVTAIQPKTKVGTCNCKCCEDAPAPLIEQPCLNDVIVAVDSSACFRDHHTRMLQFLEKLVNEFHKSGKKTEFGADKTRLEILQFSSDNRIPVALNDFDNYQDPSSSKLLKPLIQTRIRELGFLGEGAYLNKALNLTVREFEDRPRLESVIADTGRRDGDIRKVVIVLTNGKSHPSVTSEDLDNSIEYLRANGVVVLPVSVTKRCYGISSADWDEGLCPDVEALRKLAKLSTYEDEEFLTMKTAPRTVVKEATDCKFPVASRLEARDLCNNCTCDCELPIGPQGETGPQGPKGDTVQGPKGEVGPRGEKGGVGANGLPGVRGQKGSKGEVGPIGGKGEVGPIGPKGIEGIQGPKGMKGEDGEVGEVGEPGRIGDKGSTGAKGATGEKGDTGEIGPKGTKGDYGNKGAEGPKGQPGRDGESVKGDIGDDGPKGMKGSPGEFGPQGPKGMTGRQGLCGKPGPAGPQGEPGLSGVDGQDGAAGPPGIQGPRGPEGIQGEKGQRGDPGIDGRLGPIGPDGPEGPEGPRGEPGSRGGDGRDSTVPGPEGRPGQKGERGVTGENGFDGMQGPQGIQGPRGPSGPKGEEGSVDLEALRPILVEIIRELLPGECVTPDPLTEKCTEYPIDLVFLIDGSDSIDRDDFREVQQWILRTVDSFNPMDRDEKIHLNVVQFSENVENSVSSYVQESSEEVRADVEGIEQMRSGTKTYRGLRFVNSDVSPALRSGSYKILVTMTDGDASEARDQEAIDTARSFYNIMLGVGIGAKIDEEELKDFSHLDAPPITVEQFGALEGIIDQIVEESCRKIREDEGRATAGPVVDGGEPTPPPDLDYSRCAGSRADVAFVVDGSSSVGDEDFQILRQFLYDMASSFEYIEPDGFRVAVIQYNEDPRIELSFEESTDQRTVLNAIDNLEYLTGNTQTGRALDTAYELFREIRDSGQRAGVAQVVIVITDGRSQDDVAEPAIALKEDGVTIYAIGVTDLSEYQELTDMASEPTQDHIYTVDSYGGIEDIKETLLQNICRAVRGTYRGRGDSVEAGPAYGSGEEDYTLDGFFP